VRCEFGNANPGCEFLDDVPYGLLRYTLAPSSTRATHTTEKPPRLNSGSLCPFVHQAVHPIRDGNSSDATGLSAEVYDCPTPFALLQVAERQLGEFMATETAGQQDGEQSPITFALQSLPVWCLPECMPCSAVSQLPSLTPSFLTPLTRRIPAAKSALRRPQSEASYASRRTAPSRRLIVPGAKWRDSRCIR